MSDDILEIPEFLRNLDDGPKVKREWVAPVVEKIETKRDDGTILIRHITVEEGYYTVDGVREEKEKPTTTWTEKKPKRSNGKKREQWLTDIIRNNPDLTRVELYKHIRDNQLEPHEGFVNHKNFQAHLRSILIRLKKNGILMLKNNRYLIRNRKNSV